MVSLSISGMVASIDLSEKFVFPLLWPVVRVGILSYSEVCMGLGALVFLSAVVYLILANLSMSLLMFFIIYFVFLFVQHSSNWSCTCPVTVTDTQGSLLLERDKPLNDNKVLITRVPRVVKNISDYSGIFKNLPTTRDALGCNSKNWKDFPKYSV